MITYKTSNFVNYKGKISESLLNWGLGKEKVLNVIAAPYSSQDIFLKVILFFISLDKKVIYITEETEDNIQLLNFIKKYTDFRNYTYIRNNFVPVNSQLLLCNYKNAVRLQEKYDLVIYNDTSSFPEFNCYEIMDLTIKCAAEQGKIICSSIESIFKNQRDIIVSVRDNKKPLIEPRNVITRIDLNKEIPYMIYDYLNFSIENDRKVIIYLPDSEKVRNVYAYLCNFRSNLSKNIMYYINGRSEEKLIYNFNHIKRAIIITDDYKDKFSSLDDTDIIVYFADNDSFNYKKLIYFCGKAGRSDKIRPSEVIFLANQETWNMEKAKSIIRNFNKEAWEKGLLNI